MKNTISTQVRIPEETWEYITAEAARMGIAKNAMLVFLVEQGKRVMDAKVTLSE